MIRKFILWVLFVLSLTMIPAGEARAQFFLEQGKMNLYASGGDRIHKSLTIHNTSDEDQSVKVYWEDFEYQPPFDGSKKFLPVGTGLESSMSEWINFSPQEFTLPPHGKKEIEYSISIPNQFEAGYYGVLFFERSSEPYKDATGMNIVTRVGALFFVEPKIIDRTATLENIRQDVAALSGEFHNTSRVILIPDITYYVLSQDGMAVDRGELKKLYVPPAATANWKIALPSKLGPGVYTMIINADLGDGNVVVKEIGLAVDTAGSLTINVAKD